MVRIEPAICQGIRVFAQVPSSVEMSSLPLDSQEVFADAVGAGVRACQ